jgi:hypothetical protein
MVSSVADSQLSLRFLL